MSFNLDINLENCTKCGFCERACTLKNIEMIEDIPTEHPNRCVSCGHCAAICPVDAIALKDSDMSNFTPIQEHGINYESFFKLVRNRKSIRNFKEEAITEMDLEKLMESVRYIPSGANKHNLKYIIITDKDQILNISKKIVKKFKFLKKLSVPIRPLAKKIYGEREYILFLQTIKLWKEFEKAGYKGMDVILRNTPCVIIIYARKKHMLYQWEAGIASYNLTLAAETLGIGTQLSGYIGLAARVFRSINKVCNVPKKNKILTAMILGYPDVKYLKTVDRKEINVKKY
jgi:nitroreductase/NAD-dependent dihydropyrimidine dehydrogenase PreA subunit